MAEPKLWENGLPSEEPSENDVLALPDVVSMDQSAKREQELQKRVADGLDKENTVGSVPSHKGIPPCKRNKSL